MFIYGSLIDTKVFYYASDINYMKFLFLNFRIVITDLLVRVHYLVEIPMFFERRVASVMNINTEYVLKHTSLSCCRQYNNSIGSTGRFTSTIYVHVQYKSKTTLHYVNAALPVLRI
jgi:hypothetical protein